MTPASPRLTGISSMATRPLLAELTAAYRARTGTEVAIESVGGVDATRRVAAGEDFDVAVLASDAIDKLIAAGRIVAGSRTDLAHSGVAIAVRAGDPRPDIGTEEALRRAVLAARNVGYSTGASGVGVLALFERWGIAAALAGRLVQAPPGVPVGTLVARGEVALGFQQLSELMPLEGIDIVGAMPAGTAIVTTFSAGLCTASTQPEAARAWLADLAGPEAAEVTRRHGMDPA